MFCLFSGKENSISVHMSAIELTDTLPCQTKRRPKQIKLRPSRKVKQRIQTSDGEVDVVDTGEIENKDKASDNGSQYVSDSGNESFQSELSSMKDTESCNSDRESTAVLAKFQEEAIDFPFSAEDITTDDINTLPIPLPRKIRQESMVTEYV